MTIMVKMLAPALSAVVMGLRFDAGSVDVSDPALGSLLDVPPVWALRGAMLSLIRVDPITLSACI